MSEVDWTRYKTKPCLSYNASTNCCPYGKRCVFVHPHDKAAEGLNDFDVPPSWKTRGRWKHSCIVISSPPAEPAPKPPRRLHHDLLLICGILSMEIALTRMIEEAQEAEASVVPMGRSPPNA